jgi:hypothetical protein
VISQTRDRRHTGDLTLGDVRRQSPKQRRSAFRSLPTAYCPPPTANCLLPTAYRFLLSAFTLTFRPTCRPTNLWHGAGAVA